MISAGCLPFTLSGRSGGETVFSPGTTRRERQEGRATEGGEGERANAGATAGLRRRVAEGSLDYGGRAR